VGYARVSTEQQDPTVQRDGPARARLRRRSHLRFDHGLTGTNRTGRVFAGAGRLPGRQHICGDQAGPARPFLARRP
jgi:hypothetical protein